MKKVFIYLAILLPILSLAHGGEDHGDNKAAAPLGAKYFSSEAHSDKYEVLIKYEELSAGKPSVLKLFLADVKTNRAIDSAAITIKVVGKPNLTFKTTRVDTGVYEVAGVFPANEIYDLQININSPLGADFIQVPKIEIGKKLAVTVEEHAHWYDSQVLWVVIGLLLGGLIMYLVLRTRYRKIATAAIFLGLLIPVSSINKTSAHGGEDHGNSATKGGGLSNSFIVEKESQFLFDILTSKLTFGNFYESTELLGTITAAPQGLAVIQTPQTGKIVSLNVRPGQAVAKGQTVAVIEQSVEAGTQIDIISQRNELNAEVKAAKAQYDRLVSIADIAAKKDVTEARARYEAAIQNLRLFNSNVGRNMGNTKMVRLVAPINGVVGTFNYAIGAVVNAGETLFELTNLNRVYVETQVFSSDLPEANKTNRFVAIVNNDTATYLLRMISNAQAVNTENQAQRVVFEVLNPNGKFKIGENVRVIRYGTNRLEQVVIPTGAIVDISGKPAVFVKDRAEQFSLAYIQKGESNSIYTAIATGVPLGSTVVTGNVYQMKMIYLGQ
ncbi:MAG TPA: efflux RND transporter periplasmic adaptor subunit [Flavisolibacter sp.]|nr:efflux RND transporter periplasmic adaptor subunit [Flavisolibacter sp.]